MLMLRATSRHFAVQAQSRWNRLHHAVESPSGRQALSLPSPLRSSIALWMRHPLELGYQPNKLRDWNVDQNLQSSTFGEDTDGT